MRSVCDLVYEQYEMKKLQVLTGFINLRVGFGEGSDVGLTVGESEGVFDGLLRERWSQM